MAVRQGLFLVATTTAGQDDRCCNTGYDQGRDPARPWWP